MIPNQMDREWNALLVRLRESVCPTADAVFLEYDIETDCYQLIPMEKGKEMFHIYLPVNNLLDLIF